MVGSNQICSERIHSETMNVCLVVNLIKKKKFDKDIREEEGSSKRKKKIEEKKVKTKTNKQIKNKQTNKQINK